MRFEFDNQCDKEWDEMRGGDRRRYCDSCDKHVHHISGMTKERALKFLEERNWEVCVDFFADSDGNPQFRERQSRLAMQADGLKQVVAAALTVLPLAIAVAFIDFDRAEPEEVAWVGDEAPAQPPIDISGPTPILLAPVDDISPNFEEMPRIELPKPDIAPGVTELPQPDTQPLPEPKVRVRGLLVRSPSEF